MTGVDDDPFQDDLPEASTAKYVPRKIRRIIVKKVVLNKKSEKIQSTISFPYMDLDAGVSVAQAILDAGGVALSREQLAGVMNLQVTGGGFITKVATARIFGLVTQVQGRFELTNLGFAILEKDDRRARGARCEAFLHVPLYKRVYEDFKGKQLPPRPHGLEQAFARYGVAPKQTTNARLYFDKSARQAGFFSAGVERLIEPIIANSGVSSERSRPQDDEEPVIDRKHRQHVELGEASHHPFIQGLIGKLPAPDTNWTVEGRAKWLQAAANIFDLMYKGDGNIAVTAEKRGD